jgi:hypothetical protein
MIGFKKKSSKENVDRTFFLSIYIFLFFAGVYTGMYCLRFGVLADVSQHYKSFKLNPSEYLGYVVKQKENDLPVVKINFNFKNYMKLSNQRSRFVYSSGHFFRGKQWFDRKEVSAKLEIKHTGNKYRAKAKLFGVNNDHFRHPYKWSFRIKTKDYIEDFQNMKFNLLQPNTRQYLSDVLCNKVFSEYGILDLKYTPINLKINGKEQDIYYVEDFFTQKLIERNGFRDSYIFSFKQINHPSLDDMTVTQRKDFEMIKKDLINYQNNVIDVDKFDILMGTIFILQNKHPFLEDNFHMFYNSVTNKVEPIIRETWFEKELKVLSASELKDQLQDFVVAMKTYNKSLHSYLEEFLENDARLQDLIQSVVSVANTMDKIVSTKEWKSLEDLIYTRYPQALFICKNLRKNIQEIIDLNIQLKSSSVVENKHYLIKNDTVLTSDIRLKNTDLSVASGVKVDLNGYNIILDGGKIEAISKAKTPIVLFNSSKDNASIFVKNAKDTCYLKNVVIKELSNFVDKYWKLPAGITFYESKVKIEDSMFDSNISGDDYINLFRCSYFHINRTAFKNVKADAIDSDFSNGFIWNSRFYGVGNDAIDGSASNIDIYKCEFENIQDKVISAGENSNFTVANSSMKLSEMVFVSKDGAIVREKNNTLLSNKLDYCVFRKKNDFGFGTLYSDKEIKNYSHLIEKRSIVYKNNKLLDNLIKMDSIKEKLYGVQYGKKSIR